MPEGEMMALTNSGFNGTVNEAQWAYIGRIGQAEGVESATAWLVSAGTGRQVSVAAQNGYALACGVLSKDTAAITANLSTPTNGQWHLIVRRINWAGDLVSVVAVPHTTTTTAVPTVAPTTFPTISSTPGTEYDQKLAWAWVNSVNTTVTLFDLRTLPVQERFAERQVRTFKVANTAGLTALTGMSEGDLADQADNDTVWRYTGAAWSAVNPLTNLQLDTTNSAVRTITQYGSGKVLGNGTVQATELVTYPVPFASNPRVIVTATGYRATGAFNEAGLSLSTNWASAGSKTSTNFVVALGISGATLANTLDYYYDWVAIGVPA